MKKQLFYFLLFLFPVVVPAQGTFPGAPFGAPMELVYGKKYFQGSFYNQLGTITKPDFVSPVHCVGLGVGGRILAGRSVEYDGHMYFTYIIPQRITIDSAETGKISGSIITLSFIGWDLLRNSKNVHFVVSGGANLGRLRIIGNERLRQKNAQLSPMISMAPFFLIGKMKLTLNFQYDYDLSKTAWKKTWFADKENKAVVAPFRQTGASAFVTVGWNLM